MDIDENSIVNPFRPCVIIPVFNHKNHIENTVRHINRLQVPCVLVNDGSRPDCSRVLMAIAESGSARLIEHPANRGKGDAIHSGLKLARQLEFTHALQIDADGQHNLDDIQRFFDVAQANPEALVNGVPIFDDSIPKARYYGRKLTTFLVEVHTLSRDIGDAMCGFRVYPVITTLNTIDRYQPGDRMEFDLEIIVRMHSQKVPIINLETKVIYPDDGSSAFRMFRDNARISYAHSRLLFGMIFKLFSNRK